MQTKLKSAFGGFAVSPFNFERVIVNEISTQNYLTEKMSTEKQRKIQSSSF